MSIASFLAWPDGSGVAGGAIATTALGLPAYVHSHIRASRRHQAQRAQRERHHLEQLAAITAAGNTARKAPGP